MDIDKGREEKRANVLQVMKTNFTVIPTEMFNDIKGGKISGSAYALYAYLLFRQGKNSAFWGSVQEMAWGMGVSVATVQRWLKELLRAGHIERIDRKGTTVTRCLTVVRQGRVYVRGAQANALPTEGLKQEKVAEVKGELKTGKEENVEWEEIGPYETQRYTKYGGAWCQITKTSFGNYTVLENGKGVCNFHVYPQLRGWKEEKERFWSEIEIVRGISEQCLNSETKAANEPVESLKKHFESEELEEAAVRISNESESFDDILDFSKI